MRNPVPLLLPVLFPSWRFFKEVGPSPRVEVSLGGGPWQEATGRPDTLGLGQMFRRLFYNADWNERLFLVSLSERLLSGEQPGAAALIEDRLAQRFGPGARYRILLVTPEGTDTAFDSAAP